MKFAQPFLVLGLSLVFLTVQATQAQERSATGPQAEVNLNWDSLSKQVGDATTTSNATNTSVENVITCNRASMLYVPNSGQNANDCIDNIRITNLLTSAQTINDNIATINTNITAINASIVDAQNRITTIKGNLTLISPQVQDLLTQYNNLSTQATKTASQLSELSTKLSDITNQITSLSNQFGTHTTQIADLYAKIAALNATISNYNNSINSTNGTINSLQNTVNALNSNTANVLYCGRSNYIFNRNTGGCALPVTRASCYFSCPSCLSIVCN